MNRRYFINGSLASLIFLSTSGCLTEQFIKSDYFSNKYHEQAISFLLTEDGSKFVVIGEKYHYIFNVSPNLKKVLLGSFRPVVLPEFSNFYVTQDNKIKGDYTLSLVDDATDEQKISAIDAGFTTDNNSKISLSGHLAGIRYSAEGFPSVAPSYKFNYPYIVEISENPTAGNKAGKILLTPIVVLADGVLILAGATLVLICVFAGGGCG